MSPTYHPLYEMNPGIIPRAMDPGSIILPSNILMKLLTFPRPNSTKPRIMMTVKATPLTKVKKTSERAVHLMVIVFRQAKHTATKANCCKNLVRFITVYFDHFDITYVLM